MNAPRPQAGPVPFPRQEAPEPDAAPDARTGADVHTDPGADVPELRVNLPRVRIDAFVASEDLAEAVERAARDRKAARSEIALHRGGFAEATGRYRDHAPPDLVVIEDSGTADQLAWRVEALAEFCPSHTRLLLIGARNDIGLYRRLVRIGVSDYLVAPVTSAALLDAVATIFAGDEGDRDPGLVIAFLGARGGVGSSTLAHNAARILSRDCEGAALLIDADIGFGTAALQFDATSPHGLADALKERENLDSEVLDRLVHWRDKRFGILAAPDRADRMAPPEPGIMGHLVEQARRLAKYVVLDLPHGWAPWTAEAVAAADRVVLVATPDLPSLRNTRTLLDLVRTMRPNDAPPQLVLNRMPARGKPAVAREDFVRILDCPIAAALPWEEAAGAAEMAGRVLAEEAPDSGFVRGVGAFAAGLAGREPAAGRERAFSLARLFSRRRA